MGEGGRARQTPAARPCYHPGPAAAATKDPSTPASSPATAGGEQLSHPTPSPQGCGTTLPGRQGFGGLVNPKFMVWVLRRVPSGWITTHYHPERATKTHSKENAQLQPSGLGPQVCVFC